MNKKFYAEGYKNCLTINLHSNEWFCVNRFQRILRLPLNYIVRSLVFDKNGIRDALRNRGEEQAQPERAGAPVAWRQITIPISAEERESIKERSKRRQKSMSGYCRDILLNRDGFRDLATVMERAEGLANELEAVKKGAGRAMSLFG